MAARCVTCGRELHPERAEKYDYCTDPACQERNARGLTVLAVGVNKAADLYEIVDERARERVASGSYVEKLVTGSEEEPGPARRRERPAAPAARRAPGAGAARRRPRWTASQRDLALIYHQRGMRPDAIADRLGLSPATVIEIILAARNRPRP